MASKRDQKRDAQRDKLIAAAEKRMKDNGLTGLRARDVTTDAGCALGGLYTAFNDLDDLILHVNARTLDRMGAAMKAATDGLDPTAALHALAQSYAGFAKDNRALWDALFDHAPTGDEPIPEWFRAHQRALMAHIVEPLALIQPKLSEETLYLRARTYFSAIHGIVAISLQGRFVGLPGDHLSAEIERIVGYILAGSLNQGDGA